MNVHEETYRGHRIEVYTDDFPIDPREWDHNTTMFCWHKEYELGDVTDADIDHVKDLIDRGVLVSLPLYLYDHSGISMSTNNSYPFNCPWDAGQVGWITMPKDYVEDIGEEQAMKIMRKEVAEYDAYLAGEVYCWEAIEIATEETADGDGSYYGDSLEDILENARKTIDTIVNNRTNVLLTKQPA